MENINQDYSSQESPVSTLIEKRLQEFVRRVDELKEEFQSDFFIFGSFGSISVMRKPYVTGIAGYTVGGSLGFIPKTNQFHLEHDIAALQKTMITMCGDAIFKSVSIKE